MLPLGLSGCPSKDSTSSSSSSFGAAVHAACAALLPKVAYLPVSVSDANAGRGWMPARDARTGRVHRSPLQLSPATLLLVDELTLGAGKLAESGVRSLKALHSLVQDQVMGFVVLGLVHTLWFTKKRVVWSAEFKCSRSLYGGGATS
jgi:hypothetical protein